MKLMEIVASIICNTLSDPQVLERARLRKGAFTRNCGKLPFWTMMELLLKSVNRSTSSMLDEFFSDLRKKMGNPISQTIHCSQQAFSKARAGISHTIFQECFENVLDFLCCTESLNYHRRLGGVWGIQPIAIDGSKIPLPNRKALLHKYGSIGRGANSPTAMASIAYDVLNHRILDALLEPMSVDERTLAVRHMDHIRCKSRTDLLYTMFIFDRGYASKKLISYIENEIHARYLFRLRSKFNLEIDAVPLPSEEHGVTDQVVTLYEGMRVRVLRFSLPSGVTETLITNDFSLDKTAFKALYFLRWPVEEEYKLIKEKVGLTNFNGFSENSIQQEFWISVLLANLAMLIKTETDGIIDETVNTGHNKHRYQTNMNELIGCISRYFPEYMEADTCTEQREVIRYIFCFAISTRVRDKKGNGESHPRKNPRNVKHHYNCKATH